MTIRAPTRRLRWLIPLLAGCPGDDIGGNGGMGSTTSHESGATTTSTMTAGVDDTDGDTTDGDTTDGDSTDGGSSTSTGATTGNPNGAPEAADDVVFTTQDTAVAMVAADGVLANDTDPDADTLTVTDFDAASTAGGTVVVADDGGLDYSPAAGVD